MSKWSHWRLFTNNELFGCYDSKDEAIKDAFRIILMNEYKSVLVSEYEYYISASDCPHTEILTYASNGASI